jgi:hypothetical protein
MKLSPKSETAAYLIWHHCRKIGWNITTTDCARELNMKRGTVQRIVQMKGWNSRFRTLVWDRQGFSKLYNSSSWGAERTPNRMTSEQAQEELG